MEKELDPSELGTLEFWEKTYALEIENFKDHGDSGEVWFGNANASRVVNCINSRLEMKKDEKIIDLGCGNGMLLVDLAENGFENLVGVDYSQKAIDLADAVLKDNKINSVKLQVCDILDETNSLPNDFKLAHDKGTYDAISLNPENPKENRIKYIKNIHKILLPGGYLLLTSCNWTKDELIEHFREKFNFLFELPTKTFSFGGQTGNTVTQLVFTKQ
ncbi:EEF1A lysine methyltransferase 2 [Leptopilina heterotoma]|uniref:EEF1A lysine methyltransferase 2 n=1 Tax=Leptopilina heterotoma TaxID=63436 RepID=UPI001CA92512|nr:EEF1A lysine methyltransferase 2 [Leptopilina heterotoma]